MHRLKRIAVQGVIIFSFLILSGCSVFNTGKAKTGRMKILENKRIEYDYFFLEANRQKMTGDYKNALAWFQRCTELDGNRDAAWFEIANLYYALEEFDKAENYAKRALELDGSNKWYYFQLARIYVSKGDISGATKLYKNLIELEPETIDYKLTLAGLLSESNRFDEAIELLDEIESNGLIEEASLLRHSIYLDSGNFERAFRVLQSLIELNPDEIRYRGMLAELYSNLGMDSQTLEEYITIFKKDPDNYTAHLSIAEYYRRKGKYEEAFYHYAYVFRSDAGSVADQVNIVYMLMNDSIAVNNYRVSVTQLVETMVLKSREQVQARMVAADYFLKTDQYERATIELVYLTEQFPENKDIWEQLIMVLSHLEKYDEIIEFSGEAIKSTGENSMLRYFRGHAFMRLKQEINALVEIEKGLSALEDNEDMKISFMIMMADGYHRLKDYTKSEEWFEEALRIDPGHLIALNNFAYYLSERGESLDRAKEMSEITINAEPENSTFLDTYAWVLYKKGEFASALEVIELAVKFLDEENSEIFEHYGDILWKNGLQEKAIEYWKKSFELEPERTYLMERIFQNSL